jgi:hypothetical protein
MMASVKIVLLVFALVFEVLAALGVPSPRLNLIAAGLACWLASIVLPL